MTWTTVPAAGSKLRAATLSALVVETRPLSAFLTANQALATGTTVLANVTELVVTPRISTKYFVKVLIAASNAAGTTEDIKIGFTFASGADLRMGAMGGTAAGVAAAASTDVNIQYGAMTSGTTAYPFGCSTSATTIILEGVLTMSSTAGNLQVQAAQNTSGGNATSVLIGSTLIIEQAL